MPVLFTLTRDQMRNEDLARRNINRLLQVYAPGYGSSLPSASASPDGRYFSVIGGATYQNRGNAWVAI
jgi:hypothetical protein